MDRQLGHVQPALHRNESRPWNSVVRIELHAVASRGAISRHRQETAKHRRVRVSRASYGAQYSAPGSRVDPEAAHDGDATETAPMMMKLRSTRIGRRARG